MLTEDSSVTIKRVLENRNIQNLISVRNYPVGKSTIKTLDKYPINIDKYVYRRCCSVFFVDF